MAHRPPVTVLAVALGSRLCFQAKSPNILFNLEESLIYQRRYFDIYRFKTPLEKLIWITVKRTCNMIFFQNFFFLFLPSELLQN